MTKTIFVTGGSRGIGEAVVRLAAGKYNVAFTFLSSEDKAIKIENELGGLKNGVMAIKCDIRDAESVKNAVEKAKKRFGKIDVLINNAGVSCTRIFTDLSASDIKKCFDTNVFGTFNVTSAILPDMLKNGGSIVNVSSVWGEIGASGESVYAASKAAVIGFTKSLAKEVAYMNVKVNAVAPGAVDTDMMKEYSAEEVENLIKEKIPSGRLATPEEIAKVILFVAEQEYMSGATIRVDGLLE